MPLTHTPGAPRIGTDRALPRALDAYRAGEIGADALEEIGRDIRRSTRAAQRAAGLSFVTVGDFSFFDHVLDMSATLGAVPARFGAARAEVSLDTRLRMALGEAPSGAPARPCARAQWFGTAYHCVRPELEEGMALRLSSTRLLEEAAEALAEGHPVKAVLPGPVTWASLARGPAAGPGWLPAVAEVYATLIARLAALGVAWVQLDEPVLATDLAPEWQAAFAPAYARLAGQGARLLLAAGPGRLGENLALARDVPVDGLHLDLLRGGDEAERLAADWPAPKVLSAGIIDGQNVWRCDPAAALARLAPLARALGARLWLAPTCSLMHVPADLAAEQGLDPALAPRLAFARQKLDELTLLARALETGQAPAPAPRPATPDPAVRAALAAVTPAMGRRASPHPQRAALQRARLKLPPLPVTTLGAFPKTGEIRAAHAEHARGEIDEAGFLRRLGAATKEIVARQEELGLDVLVHGAAERDDPEGWFAGQLRGFALTGHGWVQSFGAECVRPPILHGDVSRPRAMTVDWTVYAQSLTRRPVKGLLPGPVTLLNRSFVREDQPRAETCAQLALALRAEVSDLETVGIRILQLDEAGLHEGLPPRAAEREEYLAMAAAAFRLATAVVGDATQIHAHVCLPEAAALPDALSELDADVLSLATPDGPACVSALRDWPNDIAAGAWNVGAPGVPEAGNIATRLRAVAEQVPAERLWLTPDRGLAERDWDTVEPALRNMVAAARALRAELGELSAAS
ncbi:5-methyltetrahydropteroyltriglutamate--homocysteine S-methyltransferase [Oceanicella sp. SM1341]|uniref:5-methyltetrahydropteroyltriglutamate-- homocysteine S-methyltransferase n=1 Tax=Oceanicella sp. SM1341 TaxID=1548889 RepID=UPI000E4B1BF1|nr:5-methyltetrahydropteroyltriglutamate--homocysteine S-methyltransferase [Oceanicella sp. SM1341]